MKPEKKRRNIVARIAAAENKSEAIIVEAKRAGVSTRTIERWVEASNAATAPVRQDDVSENVVPPEKGAENPVVDNLLKGEGAGEKTPDGPPTKEEVLGGALQNEIFCVETIASLQATAGSFIVSMRYSPPLDATSPEVVKLFALTKPAELAIRANAPRLYPMLAKAMSNYAALFVTVGASVFGMVMGIESLAKSKGWVAKGKDKRDGRSERPAAAVGGSPTDLREQIEKARADLKPTPVTTLSGAVDNTPTVGTINAPPVNHNAGVIEDRDLMERLK